jgi:hypothetical protein
MKTIFLNDKVLKLVPLNLGTILQSGDKDCDNEKQ